MGDWNDALLEVCRLLEKEAAACIADIVPGDEIGRRAANARAGALLTAIGDVTALKRPAGQDGGWVLVPKEPTDSMIEAAWDSFSAMCHSLVPEHCYKAMLSAAPASTETTTKGSSRG